MVRPVSGPAGDEPLPGREISHLCVYRDITRDLAAHSRKLVQLAENAKERSFE